MSEPGSTILIRFDRSMPNTEWKIKLGYVIGVVNGLTNFILPMVRVQKLKIPKKLDLTKI